ncbi:MAG: LysE family transporter [Acidimicrobiia bacterium]|nr:LysE family transporter [Acidimicrobiia bacterium]
MEALLSGLIAGYGIAIPVGAIAVLIIEVGIRCGFRCAASAGAGAATADLLYASVAMAGGAALAATVESIGAPLRYASAAVLIVIAVTGLRRVFSEGSAEPIRTELPDRSELLGTYVKFLGLTIINPLTIVYFAAFVVGLGLADGLSLSGGVVFAVAAFLASLSWQLLLAGIGAVAGQRLPTRLRRATVLVGNLMVLVLAVVIAVR